MEDSKVIVERSDQREATSVDWKDVTSINPPPSKWTGSITVGANDQTGNTETFGAAIDFKALRQTETNRFSLGYLFNYSHANGAIAARNQYGFLKYDYFFTPKFYGFVGTELLSNTFQDLKLRVAVGLGGGYQVWNNPIKFLSFDVGLSYINEDFTYGNDEDFLALRIGANFRYKLASFLAFSDSVIFYPQLNYIGRYLLHNEAALSAPVGSGWALKLANILDQNSNPPPATEKTDIQWILGLQYSF